MGRMTQASAEHLEHRPHEGIGFCQPFGEIGLRDQHARGAPLRHRRGGPWLTVDESHLAENLSRRERIDDNLLIAVLDDDVHGSGLQSGTQSSPHLPT